MKDHEKRELVSELVGIARIAHGTEQLRDRIAYALSGVFSALDEATARAERSEAEMRQEPVATVYIGSAHCKIAFTDAAKEAMKGRQGQSFDVYADPMPRAVKESLTVESVAAQVPKGWIIRREGDAIIVQHPDIGGCAVQKEPDCDRMIPEAILWALASDMLQGVNQKMTTEKGVKP